MPSRKPTERLNDILVNIGHAREFVSGMTFAAFAKNRLVRYAVERAVEIISEASRRLPDETKARMTGLNWRGIAAVGNVYRHEYETVDDFLVWNLVHSELAPLEAAVRAEIKHFGGN
jgi:uncharacterized protein with HEPN domain